MNKTIRKLKVDENNKWTHHRSGWAYCVKGIKEHLHSDDGMPLFSQGVETLLLESRQNICYSPWIGFLHLTRNCMRSDYIQGHLKQNGFWRQSTKKCKGLFALSECAAEYFRPFVPMPVCSIFHPTELTDLTFDFDLFLTGDQRLLHIGHWLRIFDSFYKLKTTYKKTVLCCGEQPRTANAEILPHQPSHRYDKLLQSNIVFVHLVDSSANNVVIECAVRNTPILINRLDAVVEYLGTDYPFYFETLEEAADKLADPNLIRTTHEYLRQMPKDKFTLDHFIRSITSSEIYESL